MLILSVPESSDNAIISLELLLDSIEREIISGSVCQKARRFKFLGQLYEVGALSFVEQVFHCPDQLHLDPLVVNSFPLAHIDHDLPLNVFTVLSSQSRQVPRRLELCRSDHLYLGG